MRRVSIGAALLCLAVACVAHEKNGDSAAAVGDWRSAFYEYGQAVEGEPNNVKLREKYDKARAAALDQASQKAQACASGADWSCALEQADFVLSLDGGNRDMASLRGVAAKAVALSWVQSGRDEGSRANYSKAFELLGKAVSVSKDPEVAQAALSARGQVLTSLDTDVDRFRSQQNFPAAIQLLELATRVDGAHRARLEAVRQEQSAWLETQYEQHAKEGDLALAAHRWGDAAAAYQAALNIHPGGRAEAPLRYAAGMDQGEQGLARQDFRAAADGFRQAAASGMDRDAYASTMLQRVEIRPYQVRLRSVLVYAFRPNGLPWGGRRDPAMEPLLRALATTSMPRGEAAPEAAIAQARAIPLEFAPLLQVEAAIPDRGVLYTPPIRGFYAVFDASFVVMTNGFDARPLQLRVRNVGEGPEDAGVFAIPLRDLISTGRVVAADRAVARLELYAQPAVNLPPNAEVGWSGSGPDLNGGPPPPPSGEYSHRGFFLSEVALRISREELPGRRPGPPTPGVEVSQGERILFRNQADRTHEAQWAPADVRFNPHERLRVRVFDFSNGTGQLVLDTWVEPPALRAGLFETSTPRGSWVRLRFGGGDGPRNGGPYSGPP